MRLLKVIKLHDCNHNSYYGDLSAHYVEYDLYVNEVQKRSYQYTYARKGIGWIEMLPLGWFNAFTNSHEDALETTAYEFLVQATKNGIFD